MYRGSDSDLCWHIFRIPEQATGKRKCQRSSGHDVEIPLYSMLSVIAMYKGLLYYSNPDQLHTAAIPLIDPVDTTVPRGIIESY